uniref:Uncharacterized protein n=1 Tax=Molossus molossus TaxID=27622 RepID=A0A7J8GQ00_MOLMO|nr:hypothetical protein HJG59_011262 [Molossus molossus]
MRNQSCHSTSEYAPKMAAHHPGATRKRAPLASYQHHHSLVMAAELPAVNNVKSPAATRACGRLRSAPSTRCGASPERENWEAWSQRRLRGGSWREARFPFVRVRHFARQRQWRRQRRLEPLIGFRSPVVEPISAGSEPGERGTVSVRSQYPAAQSRPQRPDWRVSLTTQERPRLPSSPGSRAELSRAGRLAAPV